MRSLCGSLIVALVSILGSGCGKPASHANIAICPDVVAGCRFELGGEGVVLRFSESPRAMRPFVMEVDAPRAVAVGADFTMPGMDMVPNRYELGRGPDGHWRAKVVLPVCITGRQDWSLALTVGDQTALVPFSAGK
jgi:hypothetical protein